MIVVNRNWLLTIGMPGLVVSALEECSALMLSDLYSFAGGAGGERYRSALVAEDAPRTLLLVGMADRYSAARGLGSSIIELGTKGSTHRMLSTLERTTLLEFLAAVDHPTARAIEAAVHEAPSLPTDLGAL